MTVASGWTIDNCRAVLRPYLGKVSSYSRTSCHERNSPDPVVDVDLPLARGNTSRLGVVDGVDTSREMELSGGLLITSHCVSAFTPCTSKAQLTADDRARRSVLGDETSGDTTGREDNDGSSVLLDSSRDCCHGEGLGGLGRSRSEGTELLKERLVSSGGLGEEGSLGHHLD